MFARVLPSHPLKLHLSWTWHSMLVERHCPAKMMCVYAYVYVCVCISIHRYAYTLHRYAYTLLVCVYMQELHGDDRIEVCCASADAIQGETLDYMVLALPPSTSQWSEWLCDPSRLLTIMFWYRWQLDIIMV